MRRRLQSSYLLVTALALVLLMLPLAVAHQQLQVDRERQAVAARAQAVVDATEDGLEALADRDPAASDLVEEQLARVSLEEGERATVVDAAGDQVAGRGGGPALSAGERRALLGRASRGSAFTTTIGDAQVRVVPLSGTGRPTGAVLVARSSGAADARVQRYRALLALGGTISMAVVAVIGVVLARSITAPLAGLRRTTARVGDGDLGARADERAGPPEVRDLAADFNQMADRLAASLAMQSAFVADASHQLRTPLTALRFRLENLSAELGDLQEARAAGSPSAAPVESAIDDAEGAVLEVDRMSRLVDGLLALARADGGALPPAAPVDVRAVVAAQVDAWSALATEHGVDLRLVTAADRAPLLASTDPDRVAQILDNLVANALDAVGQGGAIRLVVDEEDGWVVLHVVDDGPGLAPEDRQRAFDRFWRRDHATAVGTALGGSGLGLAVVAGLAAVDGAVVRLDPATGGGTDARVAFRRR